MNWVFAILGILVLLFAMFYFIFWLALSLADMLADYANGGKK